MHDQSHGVLETMHLDSSLSQITDPNSLKVFPCQVTQGLGGTLLGWSFWNWAILKPDVKDSSWWKIRCGLTVAWQWHTALDDLWIPHPPDKTNIPILSLTKKKKKEALRKEQWLCHETIMKSKCKVPNVPYLIKRQCSVKAMPPLAFNLAR